jgi:hypothetical protein
MKQERTLSIEGKEYTLLISDEPQALLEAKASGRAVLGCLDTGNGEGASRDFQGIPYVVPSMEYVTEELLELILRRYLGLPWLIDETERLYIREFVKEDAENIPEEEYGKEEEIFRDPDKLEVYIKNQYGFYEYGTWAVLKKSPSLLIGMAGVSNPNLPETALQALPTLPDDLCWLTGKMAMQQKQLKPFFLIPTKSFLPDSAPGLKQKTRPPAHWQKALEWK